MSHVGFSGPSGVSRPSEFLSFPLLAWRSTGPGLAHPDARSSSKSARSFGPGASLPCQRSRLPGTRCHPRDPRPSHRGRAAEAAPRSRVCVDVRLLHPAPRVLELCGELDGSSAARCVRDYPEVYELLEKNEVNLVTISLVASILDESNAKDLIGKIRGKSQREVEAIVATYRPPVSMRDRAKPVCVAVPDAQCARNSMDLR